MAHNYRINVRNRDARAIGDIEILRQHSNGYAESTNIESDFQYIFNWLMSNEASIVKMGMDHDVAFIEVEVADKEGDDMDYQSEIDSYRDHVAEWREGLKKFDEREITAEVIIATYAAHGVTLKPHVQQRFRDVDRFNRKIMTNRIEYFENSIIPDLIAKQKESE